MHGRDVTLYCSSATDTLPSTFQISSNYNRLRNDTLVDRRMPRAVGTRTTFIPSSRRTIVKKLSLDINALAVESFPTSLLSAWEGTVHGQDDATEGGNTKCGGIQTCGDGCGQITAGGATKCGGIQTCGDGCNA